MFDSLEYLAPKRTIEYPLDGVRTPPATEPIVLSLTYAGRGTAFLNEFSKVKAPDATASQDDRCAYRERVARLFAKHAVTGWVNAHDKGESIPYSETACAALFAKLIRLKDARGDQVGRWDLIDGAIVHAMEPSNFSEPMVTAGDLGKG